MHPRNQAAREEIALKSLTTASKKLAKQLGITELSDAIVDAKHRDPGIEAMRRMEALATFMDAVANTNKESNAKTLKEAILAASDDDLIAMPGVGEKSVAALREWAATEPEPQPPVTVETVLEEPLQTTETVQVVDVAGVPATPDMPVVDPAPGAVSAEPTKAATGKAAGKGKAATEGTVTPKG